MKIILIGAPGSGKGTQAKKLKDMTGCLHIATGDILREAIRSNSELGIKAKDYIDNGKLVPDNIIIDMMKEKLQSINSITGFILDGFPRTIPQAKSLDNILEEIGIKLDKVVYIDVSLDEIVKRMAGRLTCPTCGKSYHKIFNKPKQDNLCDVDGAELIVREDDKTEVVIGRYNTFESQTEPLIEYYDKNKMLASIDGEKDIDEIFTNIVNKLKL
ncbi:MAG: adenylate kinase [Candidatus Margulisiibacteriota bacterium]|nr:MAG: adenylate kinase [Candidatus Margulisbacteria bacterium GWD2_39_127]OGI04667.1 MAG: adenylate kinase [Candidatus Margulisbacteria bacterium GWF2_38_17]OGI11915.1 MAG: adenylate kinase [Candidatus Margulisbacteria bacterium GWE2_39_32]PZM80017.1 MAG: adenylate kinase [Candidatus Margulisiibacteriota bacterium]HAR62688.1 adenylate kinase [Candidatus Margulisiibacteriota bacterium]